LSNKWIKSRLSRDLSFFIIEETLLRSIGNNQNEPVYTTVKKYGNANSFLPSAPFEASLSSVQHGAFNPSSKTWHIVGNNLSYNVDGLLAARCQYDNSGQVTSYTTMYSKFELNNLATDTECCASRLYVGNVYSVTRSTY